MNTSRHGKIARLPKAVREELNRRLADGATGRSLVEWLNAQPEVQALIDSEFAGHPIREQNLSQWKSGGYRDWLHQQEALELMASLHESTGELAGEKTRPPMSEVLAGWLAARYSVATREIAETGGEEGWKLLRQMCADVAKLRRMDQQAERLALERERIQLQRDELELERERFDAEYQPEPDPWWQDCSLQERIAWARLPQNLERICEETTEEEAVEEDHLRDRLKDREQDRSSDWSDAERIAWARLPENLRKIYYAGLTREEQDRYVRRILNHETEEDRAYFARVEGTREEAASGTTPASALDPTPRPETTTAGPPQSKGAR